jgi:pimeloyl-ACP methyl ester carboxylesterase
MATFVLIHGAWHGAWCWKPLGDELRELGHDTIAMDLPATDPDAGLAASTEAVVRAVESPNGEVVVVGHSLGGLVAPLAAERLDAGGLVYLCSFIPRPGVSFGEQAGATPRLFAQGWDELTARQVAHEGGSSSWPEDAAIEAFYHDCPPAEAARAAAQLRTQDWQQSREPCPLARLPEIPTLVVVGREERVVDPDHAREDAEAHGYPVVELPGGHSPMLARPAVLAAVLADFVSP